MRVKNNVLPVTFGDMVHFMPGRQVFVLLCKFVILFPTIHMTFRMRKLVQTLHRGEVVNGQDIVAGVPFLGLNLSRGAKHAKLMSLGFEIFRHVCEVVGEGFCSRRENSEWMVYATADEEDHNLAILGLGG
jgi:hypothetical protein